MKYLVGSIGLRLGFVIVLNNNEILISHCGALVSSTGAFMMKLHDFRNVLHEVLDCSAYECHPNTIRVCLACPVY